MEKEKEKGIGREANGRGMERKEGERKGRVEKLIIGPYLYN